jgi:hypothetical protein
MSQLAACFRTPYFTCIFIELSRMMPDGVAWNCRFGDTWVIPRKLGDNGMQGHISKSTVDDLEVPPEGETTLWDDEVKGFGVRVQQGGTKTYIVQYRAGRGRGAPLRKLKIGHHGSPWTPATARTEAKKILGQVADGKDPAAYRRAELAAPVMADLAVRFLAEHVEAKRKPRTAHEYRRLLDKVILPAIGKRKVHDVNRADVAKLHHSLRRAPYEANRALAVLGKMSIATSYSPARPMPASTMF